LNFDILIKKFFQTILKNIIFLIAIAVYIKDAKTFQKIIESVYKLIEEFENTIKKKEEIWNTFVNKIAFDSIAKYNEKELNVEKLN